MSDMTGCKGCGVGPEDDCVPECPITMLMTGESEMQMTSVGWSGVPALVEQDDRDRALSGPLLSAEEHALMESISVVSGRFRALIGPDRGNTAAGDWQEVARSIHDLQGRVLSMAAARAYPGRYRGIFLK